MQPEGPTLARARLAVLAAAVLWSTSGAAIKSCTLNGWQISLGRSAIAAAFLFVALPNARRAPTLAILGPALAYAATVALYVLANKRTTAANAIFLQDTAPLYVLVLAGPLLGERPKRADLVAAPLFLGGLALFFVDRLGPGQAAGNALALASGVAFALCILSLRRLGGGNLPAIAWGNVIAALASLPGAFGGPHPTATDFGILVFLGVFQLGIAYALFAYGVTGVTAAEASLLALLEPVLNPLWTFVIAHERPGSWALAGGALVILATAWRALAPRNTG